MSSHLASHNSRLCLGTLVDEDHILHNERDQRLDRTGTQSHDRTSSEVRLERSRQPCPQPTSPCEHGRQKENRTTANGDGEGDQQVARDAVGEQRDSGQHGHLLKAGRLHALRNDGQGVELCALASGRGNEVDIPDRCRVEAGVFEEEYGDQRTDDDLGGEGQGTDCFRGKDQSDAVIE